MMEDMSTGTLCCSDGCEIWKFLDQWREGKGQEVEGHLDYEVEGIHEILRNCSMLSVRMGGIYVDDPVGGVLHRKL